MTTATCSATSASPTTSRLTGSAHGAPCVPSGPLSGADLHASAHLGRVPASAWSKGGAPARVVPDAERQTPAQGRHRLGISTKLPTPPLADDPGAARRRRYDTLDVAQQTLPGERVGSCSRYAVPGDDAVTVNHNPTAHTAHFSGVSVCGDVWRCPVCSARIMAERRGELQAALDEARRRGWSVVLVTVTLRHSPGDALTDLLGDLGEAWTRTRSGAPWVRLKDRHGVVGDVVALEVKHGGAGWHPHKHAAMFLDHVPDADELGALQDAIGARFRAMAAKVGRYVSQSWGVDVRGHRDAMRYISKLDAELTSAEYKTRGGVTPFAILAAAGRGDRRALALWLEYADAIKGRQKLRWSRGLRDLLGVGELSDQEAAELPEDADAAPVVLAVLDPHQWFEVVRRGRRGELLQVAAATGSRAAVWAYLTHVCGVTYGPWNREREQAAVALGALTDRLLLREFWGEVAT